MLAIAASVAKAVLAFLLFGYCEVKFGCGYIVGGLLCLNLVRRKVYSGVPLALCQYVLDQYYKQQKLGYMFFFLLDILSIFLDQSSGDNARVNYRPYEREVREFLLKNDSSKLHIVDSWLDQYKGREKQLLQLLQDRYSQPLKTTANKSSSSAKPFDNDDTEKDDSKSAAVFQMTVREKIYKVLRNNKLTKHMDKLMATYRGREAELLDILRKDSNFSSPKGVEIVQTDSINHREIFDNAIWKARSNISGRIDAASERGRLQQEELAKR